MSARKQFDVRPNPKGRPTRTLKKSDIRQTSRAKPKPLRERRRHAGMLMLWLTLTGLLVLAGSSIYGLWRTEVRIVEVVAPAQYQTSFSRIAGEVLSGTTGYVIPRDSVFFFPEKELRLAILDAHPEIAAVSIHRAAFTALSIDIILRTTAFWWCGTPAVASATDESCYKADGEGFIYAALPTEAYMGTTTATSSLPTATTLRLYAEIDTASSTGASPLRARMKALPELPNILKFVKELKTLSILPISLAVRGDEADLYLPSGTRLTYVVGDEMNALSLASSLISSSQVNLFDGSIRYVDLRFPGKVYLKRTGE